MLVVLKKGFSVSLFYVRVTIIVRVGFGVRISFRGSAKDSVIVRVRAIKQAILHHKLSTVSNPSFSLITLPLTVPLLVLSFNWLSGKPISQK